MPLYEYVCSQCKTRFELIRPISCSREAVTCPHCQAKAERVPSSFASFSKDESGLITPTAGSSCAGCSASGCDSCHL
jgi:putative FmdB family regulatory protein